MTIFIIAFLICIFFLSFRSNYFLAPSNMVFANYFLYFVMPAFLFIIFDFFRIEYILPWGMINDWSQLTIQPLLHYLYCFFLVFGIFRIFESGLWSSGSHLNIAVDIRNFWLALFLICGAMVTIFYTFSTGGMSWILNYQETYLLGKEGLGFYNILLIWYAHFLAFILGLNVFKARKKINLPLLIIAIAIISWLAYIQGVKSRIPLLLLFFFSPILFNMKLRLMPGIYLTAGLLILFSVGMYFRSEGFYSSPRMAFEYLLSYFNTIFLHEMVLNDIESYSDFGIFTPFTKYLEIFDDRVIRSDYDLSVYLTQLYYPEHWEQGATQQWPLESSFYIALPHEIFWILPTFLWAIMTFVWVYLFRYSLFFLFPFVFEVTRVFSVFRGGIFSWEIIVNYVFIIFFFICFNFLIKKLDQR